MEQNGNKRANSSLTDFISFLKENYYNKGERNKRFRENVWKTSIGYTGFVTFADEVSLAFLIAGAIVSLPRCLEQVELRQNYPLFS